MVTTTEYSYFDQFGDVQIDLTPYFDAINANSKYEYSFTNVQPVLTTLKNIFEQVDLLMSFKSNVSFFTKYQLKDKDTPESVALATYSTMDYWWIIAIFNDMKNMVNDWVMTEEQLQLLTDKLFAKEGKYRRQVYYGLLHERNEANRNILILKPVYVNQVVSTFRQAIENL
jgi:hypothetical protein